MGCGGLRGLGSGGLAGAWAGGEPNLADGTVKNMSKKQKRTIAPIAPPITFVLVFMLVFVLRANQIWMELFRLNALASLVISR
jgi:hypothetical protein